MRTVRRPKTPGAPAGAQRSGSGGERRRSGTSEFSRVRGNERCVACVDEVRQFHPPERVFGYFLHEQNVPLRRKAPLHLVQDRLAAAVVEPCVDVVHGNSSYA